MQPTTSFGQRLDGGLFGHAADQHARLLGATNATLTLSGMGMGNAGQYTVTARNAVGTVANASAEMSIFAMQLTNGIPHLSVAAPSGSHFRIDYSDMLAGGANWQVMTNFTMLGSTTR